MLESITRQLSSQFLHQFSGRSVIDAIQIIYLHGGDVGSARSRRDLDRHRDLPSCGSDYQSHSSWKGESAESLLLGIES